MDDVELRIEALRAALQWASYNETGGVTPDDVSSAATKFLAFLRDQ